MKTVRVMAANLRTGDIYNGQRIRHIEKHGRRVRSKGIAHHKLESTGVVVLAPNPNGYSMDVFKFRGDEFVCVKRPKMNMNLPRRSKK